MLLPVPSNLVLLGSYRANPHLPLSKIMLRLLLLLLLLLLLRARARSLSLSLSLSLSEKWA